MPHANQASWVKRRKVWSKRFTHPIDGKSSVLQVSARQLANGWKYDWQGVQFDLEPQDITSKTKEGTRDAANRWVEYVTAVLSGKSGKDVNQVDLLNQRIADLENEIEVLSDHIVTEQNTSEIEDIKDEIKLRKFASQQGKDFDSVRDNQVELLQLLGGNIGDDWSIQKTLLLSGLNGEPEPEEKLLSYWRDRFLELKRAEKTKRGIGRFDNVQREVNRFVTFMGDTSTVDQINEDTWQQWYLQVIGSNSPYTQRDLLSTSRAFVRHLYEQRQIELPRNLTGLQVTVESSTIEHYTTKELQDILANADGILKCFLYLMANCGFYQKDIATLTPDMLVEGYITRKRSKRVRGKKVPTVSWKLWPQTQRLIEQFRTDENGLVFTRDGGQSWKVEKQKADGKLSKHDAIGDLWKPYKDEQNIRLDMMAIRKTAANLLQSHEGCVSNRLSLQVKFLGQTPSGTALKYYVDPPQHEIDDAITRLGELLLSS